MSMGLMKLSIDIKHVHNIIDNSILANFDPQLKNIGPLFYRILIRAI